MPKKSDSQNESKQESNSTPTFVNAKDFSLKNKKLKPIDLALSKDKEAYTAFPKYVYSSGKDGKASDGEKFIVVTGRIKMTKGGIPKIHPKYRPTDDKREFFWLPWDESQEACNELFGMFNTIDDDFHTRVNTKKNKDGLISKINPDGNVVPMPELKYERTVRMSQVDDDAVGKDGKKLEPYKRLKVRLATSYEADANTPHKILTKLFLLKKRTPEVTNTVSDVEKSFCWNCTAQFVLEISKMYVMKAKDDNGTRKTGFTVKCLQIIVHEKPDSKQSVYEQFSNRVVADSDDEEENNEEKEEANEEEQEETKSTGSKKNTKSGKQEAKKVEASDNEEESEDESEDSDEDSSEEDSEDESEEEQPAKNSKGKSKTPAPTPAKAPAKPAKKNNKA